MESTERHRIDKFLWAVRVYKTRSLAAEACNKGRIIIQGTPVKPSREVKLNDLILIRKLPVVFAYRVKKLLLNRVAAANVHEYVEDLTGEEELTKTRIRETVFYSRKKGMGRPTKKERRLLDEVLKEQREKP